MHGKAISTTANENTIFVFSSDNGGEHGPSSNHPLRGEKATLFEGGTRVPGMVHSPLQNKTGIISDQMMYVTDWFATFVSLAGGCIDDLDLDSKDQTDLIMNGGYSIRTEFVYNMDDVIPQAFGMSAIRMGDYKMIYGYPGLYDGWEGDAEHPVNDTHIADVYHINDGKEKLGIDMVAEYANETAPSRRRRGNYNFDWGSITKYAKALSGTVVLYNVMEDPEERHDISKDHPELVQVMSGRMFDLYQEVGDIEKYFPIPEATDEKYDGVWTPGWCPWLTDPSIPHPTQAPKAPKA